MPIDPQGGGSWIGVNDAGLIVTLLNQSNAHSIRSEQTSRASAGMLTLRSRGEVVSQALACSTLSAVAAMLRELDANAYGPFVLIATDGVEIAQARTGLAHDQLAATQPRAQKLSVTRCKIDGPRLWSSSSLGDALVVAPRERLFAEMVMQDQTSQAQDAFHQHAWADRPWQSVLMEREDARTVSTTTCQLQRDSAPTVRLLYTDLWTSTPSMHACEMRLRDAGRSSELRTGMSDR